MKYASIGSITHGTLRTEDLLDAFAQELDYQVSRQAKEWCDDEGRKERDELLALVGQAREIDPDSEDAAELVEELATALERFAPSYTYFGAHPGDGSDFGFWVDEYAIRDAIHDKELGTGDELPCAHCTEFGEFLVVSDHGNQTMFLLQNGPNGMHWIEGWACV